MTMTQMFIIKMPIVISNDEQQMRIKLRNDEHNAHNKSLIMKTGAQNSQSWWTQIPKIVNHDEHKCSK